MLVKNVLYHDAVEDNLKVLITHMYRRLGIKEKVGDTEYLKYTTSIKLEKISDIKKSVNKTLWVLMNLGKYKELEMETLITMFGGLLYHGTGRLYKLLQDKPDYKIGSKSNNIHIDSFKISNEIPYASDWFSRDITVTGHSSVLDEKQLEIRRQLVNVITMEVFEITKMEYVSKR